MPSLRDCIGKAGKLISPADAEAMHAKAKQYLADGHPVEKAERYAVDHFVTEANTHLDSIYHQAGVGRYGEKVPVVGKEDPVRDRIRYEEVQKEMTQAAKNKDHEKLTALWKEFEDIRNRNSSNPGNPPEPITEEQRNAVQKSGPGEASIRQTPEGSEGVRGGNAVDQGAAPTRETKAGGKGAEPVRAEVAPSNKHGEIAGDKITKEWTQFHPEAKGLGIPREEMPQVHAEHRGALTQFLKGQGIESKQALVRPTDLKPTQNEYSEAKVEKARKFEGGDRAILVSSDNHVVDGHHQWVAALHDDPKKPMRVIRLDAPIKDLLPKVHEFPSAETAKGATASAGERQEKPAEPQPSAKGAAAAVPAADQEGSGKFNAAKKQQELKKGLTGKVIGIGATPQGDFDILNHIEQAGGIKTKASAEAPSGEYDDQSYPGVAARLLRKDGVPPDQLAAELHADGHLPDGDVGTLNAEIRKAVEMRQKSREAMKNDRAQQKRGEYLDKFEAAFMQGEQKRPWLRGGKEVTVDQLSAGNTFEVNGEKFTVEGIDEHGNVTIKDGITRTVPAGTRIFPDKGKIKGGKPKTDFLPEGETVEPAGAEAAKPAKGELFGDEVPFNLAGDEEKAAEGPKPAADKGPEMFAPEETRSMAPTAMDKANEAAREAAAKKAAPEPSITEAPRKSVGEDMRKPPAQMSRTERVAELTEAGVKEINGKPLADASPAEIINAVGKLRRGQLGTTDAPKSISDKLIAGLEKAKFRKPGQASVAVEPFTVAYDMAIDMAIAGVKAGRELAHMVELAVKRFKAAYPGATKADQTKLEQAIRDAHAAVHGTADAQAPTPADQQVKETMDRYRKAMPDATPKEVAKVEAQTRERVAQEQAAQKAAEVVESPKAEETKSKIIAAWNEAAKRSDIKETLTFTKEAGENQAKQTGREAETTVANELKRSLGEDFDHQTAGDAIGMHVEAGRESSGKATDDIALQSGGTSLSSNGGRARLAEMRAKLEASTKADPKWKARAIAAVDYASKNYEKMQKAADLYRALTKDQAEREQRVGLPTIEHKDYVMHAQDIEDGTWLEKILNGEGGAGMPSGASSRKNRVHATFADSVAAGVDPKTLNALDLLRARISAGETDVNRNLWQDSLHNYIDEKTKQPIAMKPEIEKRADGTTYYNAPRGYRVEMLGGRVPIAVKKEYRGTIAALTNPSFFDNNAVLRGLMKANSTAKSFILIGDTYHLGRIATYQAIQKMASPGDARLPIPEYKSGLTILDHSPVELTRMAQHGEIDPKTLPRVLEQKRLTNVLTKNGYNLGSVSDGMHSELTHKIPGVGGVNKFIFEKFVRGAMQQAGVMELERQKKSYPDRTEDQVARQVAKDLNVRFGNIGRQGWFKSRTSQDIARLIALAPQWNESLIKSEIGGVRQIGNSAKDAVLGKRLAMGALGRGMLTGAVSIFAANQVLNQATRGKFTWENPEEDWGSKLSAWIPDAAGNSSGFFLNPLGVMAEVSHLLLTRYEKTGNKWQPFLDYARGRVSAVGKPFWTAFFKENSVGQRIKPDKLGKEVLKSAAPVPISGSALYNAGKGIYNKVTGNPAGARTETFPGQFQKQAMQTFGLKTDTAPSPEQRIMSLATHFNREKKIPEFTGDASDWQELNAALRRENPDDIKDELQSLLKTKTTEQMEKHFKSYANSTFTGKKERETEFIRTLNPEQRAQYIRAKRARMDLAKRALDAIHRMPPQLQRTGTD